MDTGEVKLRLGICEDDPFTLSTLSAAISFRDVEVVFAEAQATRAIAGFREHRPHAMLIDLHLGNGPTGLDLARQVRKVSPEVGIVFLTSFESPKLIEKSFAGMPSGSQYLNKRDVSSIDQILRALQLAIKKDRKTSEPEAGDLNSLTEHQLEVLGLVAMGLTNAQIAKKLELDSKSIEGVIRRISERLQLRDSQNKNQRIQMARAYLRGSGRLGDL
jgi:two-component system, NarL family, nitrate/nitrite response regulator NarL